jgi:cell division protein FtsI/penicillin-binding protein 2
MAAVAVVGYGTVGSGVVEIIETHREMLLKKTGKNVYVKYIVDIRDFENDPYQDKLVKDFSIVENDPEILNTIPLSASTVDTIRRSMRNVIHGSSAANNVYVNFRDAEYEAGGKTGTAQAGSNASNNAWFTGFAPATDPEIVVTCMIEHGSSGGNSSFTVRKVMDAYLLSAE